MKIRLSLLIFLLAGHFTAISQAGFQVAGKVVDAGTRQPLQGASVFCQNTTIGTATGEEGSFKLSLANGGYDLVTSFTGYETQSLRISSNMEGMNNLVIELKPKEKSLEEVTITLSNEVKDGWLKYGTFFVDNFIGKSEHGRNCTIKNPQALRFFFNKKRNRLKVTGKEDLLITNNSLGYTIRYQLDSFIHEYGNGRTLYTGYPFFESLSGTEDLQKKWTDNRQQAYNGSILHFMRAYRDSTLKQAGYKIELINEGSDATSPVYNPYDSQYFAAQEGGRAELGFPGRLRIVYAGERPEASYLAENKLPSNTTMQISILDFLDALVIEENGFYYDQRDLVSLGYWGWEKVGDLLPYDYYPLR